ncbi:hypothetical protein O6H91_04G096000 [Diphasiastrum complanatum]|uniref:Uncharacterized protein n=1 Tax=Diphasiastrum complanatum TaxID=34168 RepID=A0ACC2DZK0_DIPCM|nr:hypothetical protein O6H91_04G096000 [Diphasiastrum complanatum]
MLPIGMQTSPSKHLFFVTGQPGVGKTTLIMKVLERVKDAFPELKIQGFYTRETRQAGERVGFEVVTVNGQKGVLASSGAGGSNGGQLPSVGKYKVQIAEFEAVALPELQIKGESGLFVIDEVGKMELFSVDFFPAVWEILNSNIPVLGSIPMPRYGRDIPQVQKIRNHPNLMLYTLTKENRDEIGRLVFEQLNSLLSR